MGYRTTEKLPYIEAAPSNSGMFLELFSEAAERIGYKLEVVRLPKIRILEGLRSGSIDFYPKFTYTDDRAEYTYWIKNGTKQSDIAISREEVKLLRSDKDFNGLRYLVALGNPDYLHKMDKSGLTIVSVPELSVERALELLIKNRADFYIYERDTLKYMIKKNSISGFIFHPELLHDFYWSHTGISRKSKHYAGQINPEYDPDKDKSIDNFPYTIDKECVFAKLEKTLLEMEEEGFTGELYKKYFE